jgi:hypothetical protein
MKYESCFAVKTINQKGKRTINKLHERQARKNAKKKACEAAHIAQKKARILKT